MLNIVEWESVVGIKVKFRGYYKKALFKLELVNINITDKV